MHTLTPFRGVVIKDQTGMSFLRTLRTRATCGPVPQRRNMEIMSKGRITTSPAITSSVQVTGGMPVKMSKFPDAAQPAISALVHPHRADKSLTE